MLKNANRVLKNSWTGGTTNVFKSQVVDSYIENNAYYTNSITIGVSGLSTNTPLKVFYQTPTGYIKNIYTSNGTVQPSYAATNENSYKKYFFFGKISGIYTLAFNQNYSGYYYRGDLVKLMEQFPVLKNLTIPYSVFNKNISNTTFPSTLELLYLNDTTISGDVTKIKNFDKIRDLTLYNCPFSNNFTSIGSTNIRRIYFQSLMNLSGNLNNLFANNPNLTSLYLWNCVMWSGNTTTLDVSKLTYLQLYSNNLINGNINSWTFNTGLTNIVLFTTNINGNLSNWNITNTKISTFQIYNLNSYSNSMSGSLSGWTMPTTLNQFSLNYVTGLTSMPTNFSNCSNFTTFNLYGSRLLTQDLNTINFGTKVTNFQIDGTSIATNLETWTMPTGATTLLLRNSKFTGNITGITFNTKVTYVYFENNKFTGQLVNKTFPNSLVYLSMGTNTGVTLNLDLGTFNMNKITSLLINNIGGISGNFSNFSIPNNNTTLHIYNTPVSSNLTNLNPAKLYDFNANTCGLNCDVTNWLTGTTQLYSLSLYSNLNLSGNTSNWNVNGIYTMSINSTKLSGALKHNNVRTLVANNSNISSNIRTDFNFSNRGYQANFSNCPQITGSLSGVTLNYGMYYFNVQSCPNITGANHFVNYIFTNRSYWTYPSPTFYFSNIGDNVTGATETLGDLGTYPTGATGYQWNLTEEQVNNLVVGTDYNGAGTNVKWNSKQKIYWMKNAKISSVNLNRRYANFQISYN